ncbi:hypothetical protein AV650_02345 [Serratia fonticola]|nr:hypothetical protein AV650_02345 [Serratia fonticola]
MKTKHCESVLRFLIRNYAVNSTSSFEEIIGDLALMPKCFRRAYKVFQCDYQFYVNRYMALSYIYQSLANIGSSYSTMVFLHENKAFYSNKGNDESKFFMSVNEPFGHQVIMQYAKLFEALVDMSALDSDNSELNEKDKKHALKLLSNDTLKESYVYLNDVFQKIKSSDVIFLRNHMFAHPFKNEKSGNVVFLEDVSNKVFSTFRELCNNDDKPKYDESNNRIRFFCSKYIMSANYNYKGTFRGELRVETTAQTHVKALYDFMSVLRNEKLLSEEPLLIVDNSVVRDELDRLLAELASGFNE